MADLTSGLTSALSDGIEKIVSVCKVGMILTIVNTALLAGVLVCGIFCAIH